MIAVDKTHDITLQRLTESLATERSAPLLFLHDGQSLKQGYHVTEVKAGHFSALDCGANPEAWSEIFVQLWDVDDTSDRGPMTAGRFLAIIAKVVDHVRLDGSAQLTFELSDGVAPIAIYCAQSPVLVDGRWQVSLHPRPASCKPRDRWLAGQETAHSTPLAAAAAASACCGARQPACC
ncbi:DUF6428 family protein [Rhizobium halophytocola]|uniref:Uncharacterized protein n=1 Tax=Rhizobium halophytocola TaxID=735519 RepID=A0ABS4DZQ6_9HYPH|nr:DUF6428 family protein [Rhizobium halophytocola]MBP1851176.1 hypothetical protein [Rhizobium halophytocola]